MKFWHSIVLGFVLFGLVYFPWSGYCSLLNIYAQSISDETRSKSYEVVDNQEKLIFDVYSFEREYCIIDKVIRDNNFVFDSRYCTKDEDYSEGMNYKEINIFMDKEITDQFGQIVVLEDAILIGDIQVDYPRNSAESITPLRFKVYNGKLYIIFIKDNVIQFFIIKKDVNDQLTIMKQFGIQYETDKSMSSAFHEFDFELVGDRILFVGSNIDYSLFSSWDINQEQKIIKFNTIFNEISTWDEERVIIKKNKTDFFVIFGIKYYLYKPTLDERLYFISKYDLSSNQLLKLRTFRDIDIKGYPNREEFHIKIDDDENIYFESFDGTVYTINYNSLSMVDTLVEFTKKKFFNFLN